MVVGAVESIYAWLLFFDASNLLWWILVMSLSDFERLAQQRRFKNPGAKWSTVWMKRLYEHFRVSDVETLVILVDQLVAFLQHLRDFGVPAWQRHQCAVTFQRYQTMIGQPSCSALETVIQTLADWTARESQGTATRAETHFPSNEPEEILQLRTTLRRHRYKYDTEKAYVGWVKRFLNANRGREPRDLAEPEIRQFLNRLVTHAEGGVAESTLKQAKSFL